MELPRLAPAASFKKDADRVQLKVASGTLRLRVFSPHVIEVTFAPGATLPKIKSFAVNRPSQLARWTICESNNSLELQTSELTARVDQTDDTADRIVNYDGSITAVSHP
jgi:hypothetical protein